MSESNEPSWITLSDTEMEIAGFIGAKRRSVSIKRKWSSTRDFTDSGITNDIEAVAAEMAVAKTLNIYPEWSPSDGTRAVPGFDLKWNTTPLDVKSTKHLDGNLLIPKLHTDVRWYVLVRGQIPLYEIVGWIPAAQVKVRGTWTEQSHKPCWTVEAGKLLPITTLKGE